MTLPAWKEAVAEFVEASHELAQLVESRVGRPARPDGPKITAARVRLHEAEERLRGLNLTADFIKREYLA